MNTDVSASTEHLKTGPSLSSANHVICMTDEVRRVSSSAVGLRLISSSLACPAWLSVPALGWGVSSKTFVLGNWTYPRRQPYRTSKQSFDIKMCSHEGSTAEDGTQMHIPVADDATGLASESGLRPVVEQEKKPGNEKDGYDEFSQLLGLEDQEYKSEEGRKKVFEAAPRKAVIHPRDYDIFNTLLERSGGTGRKPLKGSKRYVTKRQAVQGLKPRQVANSSEDLQEQTFSKPSQGETNMEVNKQTSASLSEEETIQAYAIMMEEFGADLHGKAVEPEVVSKDPEVVAAEPVPVLRPPPTRPGSNSEKGKRMATFSSNGEGREAVVIGDNVKSECAESALPLPSLQPKPISSVTSAPNSAKTVDTPGKANAWHDNISDTRPEPLPVPELLSKPVTEGLKSSEEKKNNTFPEESAILKEGPEALSTSKLGIDVHIDPPIGPISPVMEMPPTRPPIQVSSDTPLKRNRLATLEELQAARSHFGSGKPSTRGDGRKNQKFWDEMKATVLQNPKLICNVQELSEEA